jgi:hypothetical protein
LKGSDIVYKNVFTYTVGKKYPWCLAFILFAAVKLVRGRDPWAKFHDTAAASTRNRAKVGNLAMQFHPPPSQCKTPEAGFGIICILNHP